MLLKNKNMKFAALGLAAVLVIVGAFLMISKNVEGSDEIAGTPGTAGPAVNQASVPENGEPWKIRCNNEDAQKSDAKRGKCEVFQQLIVKESKQRFAEFAIGFPDGQKEARGIMILPLGVLLEAGVEMQVDDQQPFKFKIRYCEPGGCAAFLSLNDSVLGMFNNGKSAKVTLQTAQGKTLSFEMSLKGFAGQFKQVS